MTQMLIHLPDYLAEKFRSLIPAKQRSKYIESLLEEAFTKKDEELRLSAISLERDDDINKMIGDWDIASGDGIDEDK